MIDAMIITYNESANLPSCLEALRGWVRSVTVIDSGSTDGTPDIARSFGASVVHHDWEGYARQKNWGLTNLPFESDWILILDADEVITPKVRDQLVEIASKPSDQVPENGFFINRLTYFLGRPIRHCGYFPSWNLRFFKRGKAVYEEREVHEHVIINDPVGYISDPMLHIDRRGLEHYIAKHNRYSTLEARALFRELTTPNRTATSPNLSRANHLNRWLKHHLLPWVPLPAIWRFIYMYVLRLGFLDGRAGLSFCRFIGMYDYMLALKLRDAIGQMKHGQIDQVLESYCDSMLAVREGDESVVSQTHDPVTTVDRVQAGEWSPAPAPVAGPALTAPQHLNGQSSERPMDRHPQADDLVADLQPHRLPPGDWPALDSVPVSVLIPVKDEQRNIAECVRHVRWANEIVVVDSGSTDQTVPIAQAMGAQVYQFKYSASGWPKKKNWALENVPWKNPWVLILDADEHMIPKLAAEIQGVVTGRYRPPDKHRAGCGDGYWLNRRFMFMGRWIKGCGYYPSYNIRLLKHEQGRYERIGTLGDTDSGDNEVHEHIVLDNGPAGYLDGDFLHFAYPDLTTWIEKHNRYSSWEAHTMATGMTGQVQASLFGDMIERRRWIKKVIRKLPFRPTMRFIYSFILQRGFMDGYPGYVMSRLMAWYEFISIAKYREMKIREKSQRR